MSQSSEILVYDWTNGGEVELVVEDIERIGKQMICFFTTAIFLELKLYSTKKKNPLQISIASKSMILNCTIGVCRRKWIGVMPALSTRMSFRAKRICAFLNCPSSIAPKWLLIPKMRKSITMCGQRWVFFGIKAFTAYIWLMQFSLIGAWYEIRVWLQWSWGRQKHYVEEYNSEVYSYTTELNLILFRTFISAYSTSLYARLKITEIKQLEMFTNFGSDKMRQTIV